MLRDYLREHHKTRDEYAKIKKEGSLNSNWAGKNYYEYKSKFLKEVARKAMEKTGKSERIVPREL